MRIWKNEETVLAIADEGKAFKLDDGSFLTKIFFSAEEFETADLPEVYYRNGREITEEMHTRFSLLHELKEIREWFASTDYIPNKVLVGEWSADDPRFTAYCEKRKQVRARRDEVMTLLGMGGLL